jgi:hypothetical protein
MATQINHKYAQYNKAVRNYGEQILKFHCLASATQDVSLHIPDQSSRGIKQATLI